MGRYTSVQSFGDEKAEKGSKITKLTYTEATGEEIATKKDGSKKLVTERVTNPSSSIAGASSSDFHTYRHVRRREAERLEKMDREHSEKVAMEEHRQKRDEMKLEFQRKTEKRRMKRERRKRRRNHSKMERELKKLKKSDDVKKKKTEESEKVLPSPPPPQSIEPPTNKNVFDDDGSFMSTFGKLC